MRRSKNNHHDQRPYGKSDHEDSAEQHKVRIGFIEVLFGLSGILVIIGTILAMSENHKIKIVAVWVFVGAVIIGSVALGIRLTHEFSASSIPKDVRPPTRPYVWVKSFKSNFERSDFLQSGVVIDVAFENASSIPAFNVSIGSFIYVCPKQLTEVPHMPMTDEPTKTALLPAGGVLHQFLPQEKREGTFDASMLNFVQNKQAFLYLWGMIRYSDKNMHSYTYDWCVIYNPKSKSFDLTPFHNQSD